MLVTPRPGVDRRYLRDTLGSVHNEVLNLRTAGTASAYQRLLAYLQWADNAARSLGTVVSGQDLDRLVFTKRYELLLTGMGSMTSDDTAVQRVVNGMVNTELQERVTAFESAVAALEEQISRWSVLGTFVMPDTSFFIRHPAKLEDTDFAAVLEARGDDIRVLVPMVVVDELDGLKQHNKREVRWRAGYTVAVLDRLFKDTTNRARLRTADLSALNTGGTPRGDVTVELVFDPPGHVRLPINDDEIIDRAVAIEPLAARQVTLLTYDTGQAMRARAAGVPVKKLSVDIGEEPREQHTMPRATDQQPS